MAIALFVAAAVSFSCGEQDYPERAFRCDPSTPDSCPGAYLCCSTDPLAIDTAAPSTAVAPDYAGGSGQAIYSGTNNTASRHGRCVDPASIAGLATFDEATGPTVVGCPLPCNPTWESELITSVCGADTFCCQTDELGERDCVLDPSLGTSGCYRPTTGADIAGFGGLGSSDWSSSDHDTHQDPGGGACKAFVEGVGSDATLLAACYRKLGVADQRGLCTAAAGQTDVTAVCPLAHPDYRDACEQLNEAQALAGC